MLISLSARGAGGLLPLGPVVNARWSCWTRQLVGPSKDKVLTCAPLQREEGL